MPTSFAAVTAQLDPGGSLYVYLSTESFLSKLTEHVTTLRDLALNAALQDASEETRKQAASASAALGELILKSGLTGVSGVGASSFALEPELFRNKLFVHHHPGKGQGLLWGAFGTAPHPLAEQDFLPVDTAFASFHDVELALLFRSAQQSIEESGIEALQALLADGLQNFATAAGMPLEEVLDNLGGSVGAVLTLHRTKTISIPMSGQEEKIPEPRLAILLKVKSDRLFQQIDKVTGGNPEVQRVDEAGLRMRSLVMSPTPQWQIRPTVAHWNNYLVFASDDQLDSRHRSDAAERRRLQNHAGICRARGRSPCRGEWLSIRDQAAGRDRREGANEDAAKRTGVAR